MLPASRNVEISVRRLEATQSVVLLQPGGNGTVRSLPNLHIRVKDKRGGVGGQEEEGTGTRDERGRRPGRGAARPPTYAVELHVEAAGVADRLALGVAAPQRGGGGLAVGAGEAHSAGGGLQHRTRPFRPREGAAGASRAAGGPEHPPRENLGRPRRPPRGARGQREPGLCPRGGVNPSPDCGISGIISGAEMSHKKPSELWAL